MTGSHIDTVRHRRPLRRQPRRARRAGGGRDAAATRGVAPRRPVAVAFFTNEEGARFAPDMMGSLVYVGGLAVEEALDARAVDDGARLGDELARIGYAGDRRRARRRHARTPSSSCTSSRARCSSTRASTIGVVDGVQGISWTEVTIAGQSNHAGTTPMAHAPRRRATPRRRSPSSCRELARRDGRRPGRPPSGASSCTPDLVNVVAAPGRDHRRPAQHRRGAAAARPSAGWRAVSDDARRRRGRGDRRPVAGPLRAGRRSTTAMIDPIEATARRLGQLDAADAVRRRARRADARPHLPDGDDLRAERRRPVSHNIAEKTPPPSTWPGADVLLQHADAVGEHLNSCPRRGGGARAAWWRGRAGS